MKLFALALIIAVVSITDMFSQNSKEDKNKPEITFKKYVHDFGNIIEGSDGSCEFEFTNTGKSPLILNNVKSSCGCTVPRWTKDPVPKKEKGVIKVKYNTKRIGSFQKTITVYSNAKTSIVRLTIKGKVEKKENSMPIKTKPLMSTE